MKPPTRLVSGVAAVALALSLASCSGGDDTPASNADQSIGSVPTTSGEPQDGGTVTVALSPGLAPNYIFPLAPAASNGSVIAPSIMWRPLYWTSTGETSETNDEISLADEPDVSSDGKTVTITLKDSYTWSDGTPVVADDLLFFIDLLKAAVKKSAANWSFYTPGKFPDDLTSATADDDHTVTLVLENAYNPAYLKNWILQFLIPLPSSAWAKASDDGPQLDYTDPKNAAAIYDYLSKASQDQSSFTTNPLWKVVNGPFQLDTFDPASGSYSLVPNEAYSGPNPAKLDKIELRAFTSSQAVLNQLRSGDLTVGALDTADIGQVPALEAAGYNVYGAPKNGQVNSLFLNFENTTNNFDKLIAQPYIRQTLQHLIDQPGYIASKGIYNGAAAERYTTVSSESEFAPTFGDEAPYPFSIDDAAQLLTEHGWDVQAGGTTTCTNPGTGDDQCGAGIPEGQEFSFNLFYANSPSTIEARTTAFVSAAKQVGITIEAASKATNYMYNNYDNNFAPQNKNKWAMQDAGPINLGGYPTSGLIWATDGAFNGGHYSSETADELIANSVSGQDPNALSAEATFLGEDLPVLFMPSATNIVVWKKELGGDPDAFSNMTQGFYTPEYWYLTQ